MMIILLDILEEIKKIEQMRKNVIKLKESDIINIVKKIIREDSHYGMNKGDKSRTRPGQEDYTGHKGDISKTHKGRDYEKGGSDNQVVAEFLGNPRTLEQAVQNYMKINSYLGNMEETRGMDYPSSEEVMKVARDIQNDGGDDEPVAMIVWWFVGIGLGVLARRLISGSWPWQPL